MTVTVAESCSAYSQQPFRLLHLCIHNVEREKLKGNEFYRVGEVEEAIRCYTRSINFDPSNHILYANRAMGYIKLEALEKAEEDCSKALQLDCTYVKAWSRRGLTRFKRGKYSLVCALSVFSLPVI